MVVHNTMAHMAPVNLHTSHERDMTSMQTVLPLYLNISPSE